MIQKPKITLIVPIYKVEKYIEDCMRSIFAQTYTGEMECILVDDCTPDESAILAERLLDSYSGSIKFKLIHHESNKGLSVARNTGIENASGDYIYFLDSDDEITSTCIDNLVDMVLKYPGVDFVQGCTEEINTRKNLTYSMELPEFIEGFEAGKMALHADIFSCNKLIKIDLIKKNHLSFIPGLLHEDVLWLYNMSKCITKFATSKEATYLYRTNNTTSIMNSMDLTKRACSVLKIYETISLNLNANKWKEECLFLDDYCKFTFYVTQKQYAMDTNVVFRTALKTWFKVIKCCKYVWPKLYGFTFLPFRWVYCSWIGYRLYCKINHILISLLALSSKC